MRWNRELRKGTLWKTLLACVSWISLVSCVSEYEPKGIDMVSGLLVVDGIITNGESVINLRRSVGLTDEFTDDEYVNDARIVVERGDGQTYPGVLSTGQGEYTIATGELDADQPYRLRVSLDGREYESDFLKPVLTPPIDNVSLIKNGPGEDVHLCVSTHNDAGGSRYYRWMYKENWELKAEIFMMAEYQDMQAIIFYDLQTANNVYYCWGVDSTKTMQLGSSDKLTENVISNKKLVTFSPADDRLSILYHAEVEQYALRAEAYDYYFNLQKNIEETGSLFTPIPSEMKGNIRCVSDPSLPVIGYVEVSTVCREKKFMPEIKSLYEPPRTYCGQSIVSGKEVIPYLYDAGYGFISYNPGNPEANVMAPKRCLDCRRNGTKKKPSWWPNNHL